MRGKLGYAPSQLGEIPMALVERDLAELPRHLLDVQSGHRVLSDLVLKTKAWIALQPAGAHPISAPISVTTRTDNTAAHAVRIVPVGLDPTPKTDAKGSDEERTGD